MHQGIDARTDAELQAEKAERRAALDAKCLSLQRLMRKALESNDAKQKREIAYRVADLCNEIHNDGLNPQAFCSTDLADFVFHYTHYEECSNWFFFRRS